MGIDGIGTSSSALTQFSTLPPGSGTDRGLGKDLPAGGGKELPEGDNGDVKNGDGKPAPGSSNSPLGEGADLPEGTEGSEDAPGTLDVDGKGKVQSPAPLVVTGELDLHALIGGPDLGGALPPALQVPEIPPPAQLGNLSTSDLIQLVRAEARKTAQELIKATAEVIKAQQIEIQAMAESKIKQINESIKKQEEAEEKKKAMDILKYVMYAISALVIAVMAVAAVVSAPFSGGATLGVLVAVSAVLLVATVMATEIKDEDGKSGMDMAMEGMAKGLAKMWPNESEDKAKENGMITGAALMAAIQVTIAIAMAVATLGTGTGVSAAFAATAVGRGISSGLNAVASAVQTGMNVSVKTMEAAMKLSMATMKALSIVQALATISTSSTKIAIAVEEYGIAVGKSQIEELKALMKMLNTLLEQDMDFLNQLMQIQSKLDQGVATIIKNEHETSLKLADIQQLA